MPTPMKTTQNVRKHLTKAERESRQAAEEDLKRKQVRLRVPDWLSPEARKIFEGARRQLRGLGLLDNSDAELLGMYADALARYRKTVYGMTTDDTRVAATAQAWSRLALQYAEKMGISASARARLAKRKAENAPLDDMDLILEDVMEYVNDESRV